MTDSDTGVAWIARHCTPGLARIFSSQNTVRIERELWLTVLRFHINHGVCPDVYWQYRRVADVIDLDRMREREKVTRHDIKARIEEFNYLADSSGRLQYVHLGMTSADIADNVWQIKVRRALLHLAAHHPGVMSVEGTLAALERYPLRGIKGAVGTQTDQLDLLGSQELVDQLDRSVANTFGFTTVCGAVGQVYPRSYDLDIMSRVLPLDKVRNPWSRLVTGYLTMLTAISGDQWLEGDVSHSVVRRVALPGLLLAADLGLQDA